ncbi:AraC family transcriptional regulator [Mesorhizobium sp. KR9-304]|uniref:AraC family transcriptional regulator n=1 Tax=Mesorhizobium sp. KR9-304 TaxID=3156614 RepID=UPI0032B3A5D4
MSQIARETVANAALSSRRLAGGAGWSLYEIVCHAGPQDRPFEERHGGVSIAAVVSGSFTYASDAGRALLHPGALLFGNHGACYRCGHEHSTGDRCVSVQFTPDYFGEIAASAAGSSRFRFPAAMLPARRGALPHTVLLEALGGMRDPLDMEERAVRFFAAAVRTLSGETTAVQHASAQDLRRVSRVLGHIEAHSAEPLDLDRLASIAATSKFHFLRIFRRAVGLTPYQFLLNTRLRRAALRLLATPDAVSAIAYDTGFGDLSTFNAAFRERFGVAPLAFRRNGALH